MNNTIEWLNCIRCIKIFFEIRWVFKKGDKIWSDISAGPIYACRFTISLLSKMKLLGLGFFPAYW